MLYRNDVIPRLLKTKFSPHFGPIRLL